MPSFSQVEKLDGGWRGTAQTISRMHRLVALGKLDPTMHQLATWLRRNYDHNDFNGLRRCLWSFLKDCGLFQRDPHQIERIEHPLEAIKTVVAGRLRGLDDWSKSGALFVGDCDLFSIMAGTIGGIWGFPYAFETVKGDSQRPDDFSHVYPLVHFPDKGYVAFDATVDSSSIGWRPPVPEDRRKQWPEGPIEGTGVSGLNGAFAYVPVRDTKRFPKGLPIRLSDLADPPVGAKEIADEVVRNLTKMQAFPDFFFGDETFTRRGPGLVPADDGFPERAVPYLPAVGEEDNPPATFEVIGQASDRPGMTEGFELFPRYHENPKRRVTVHEHLAPRFIYANQVVNKEQYDSNYTLPYLERNVIVPRGGADMAEYRSPGMGWFFSPGAISAATSAASAPVTTAGSSVWDAVGSIADKLLESAPGIVTAKIQADLQKKVLDAQQKVLDAQAQAAATAAATEAARRAATGGGSPSASYSSGLKDRVKPAAIAVGVAVLGYGVYRMTRPTRRRR